MKIWKTLVLAAAIAAPVGLMFDGSLVPLAAAVVVMSSTGFALMLHMGRLEDRVPV